MKRGVALTLLFLVVGALIAGAGENPSAGKAPKYLWIQTESVQPAKEAAYMRVTQVFKEAVGNTGYWLTTMPLAGPGGQYTYVSMHDTYASMEEMLAAFMKATPELMKKDAALLNEGMSAVTGMHSIIAEFQPELSIRAEQVDAPHSTRLAVYTYRLRPGTGAKFAALLKEMGELHKQANDSVSVTVYRVVAGEAGPTFLIIRHLKTLADLDEEPSPALKALMTPLVEQHSADVVKECVLSQEATLYMFSPELSNPPQSFLADNPGFWQVKTEEAAAPAAKKAKKPKPAALKEPEKK